MNYEAVIGLEIHSELKTNTKIFCGCATKFGAEQNTHVCPVCLGLPGVLPVLNKRVVEFAIKAGLALNCTINKYSKFDRKNYYYPDLPKNFQTSQYDLPIAEHGYVDIETESGTKRIRILRIHMEEDAGKLVHSGATITDSLTSNVDYNRTGVPLIEIVSEPDMSTPAEARAYMEKIKSILEYIDVSNCRMEEGNLRADLNISLRPAGEKTLGTKAEMKNINSFKSLHDALEYEIRRQAEVLEEGGVVYQETRHWEPGRRRTVVMRTKETADDYRLFPDPDLAPFDLSDEFIEEARERIPELPDARRERYEASFGLRRDDAAQIAGDPTVAALFEEAVATVGEKVAPTVANVVVNLLPAFGAITAAQAASVSALLAADAISFAQAREVLEVVDGTDADPERVVDERGLRQSTDSTTLEPVVDEVLDRCADQVRQYRDGNTKVVGFLVGQCMKASKAAGVKGNPKLFNQLLAARLEA